MKKKCVIGILGILLIVFGPFLFPDPAHSQRKIINFNAG